MNRGSDPSGGGAAAAGGHDEPLGLTVHTLPDPAQQESHRTRVGRWKLLLVLLVCASPVIASYFAYFVVRPDGRTNYATLILPTRTMPDLGLTTLDGERLSPRDLRDQWQLVVLGPSACEAACEERLFMQRQLREMTGRERERLDKLWIVLDAGDIRPALLEALKATPALRIARAERATVGAWLEPQAGAALEDHLYIVDPMGEWMMRAPLNPEPAQLKKDIERLLRASSFWDQPGGRR